MDKLYLMSVAAYLKSDFSNEGKEKGNGFKGMSELHS